MDLQPEGQRTQGRSIISNQPRILGVIVFIDPFQITKVEQMFQKNKRHAKILSSLSCFFLTFIFQERMRKLQKIQEQEESRTSLIKVEPI